jgi:NAD(P)H-dependent FMN reductase
MHQSGLGKEWNNLMFKIAIMIGSTRPGRNGEAVVKWVYENVQKRNDAEFELVDIKGFNFAAPRRGSAAVNGAI